MDREGAVFGIVVELHLRGVKTSFAVDKITNGGVFYDHFGPERVSGEAEKISTTICGDFDDDVGPASQNMFGF